jgi:universal stress protein A
MKLKAARPARNLVLETGEGDFALPPIGLPELRLKKILLPLDFSECSHKALHYAVSFAKQFNAEVLLLHVLETAPPQVAVLESTLLETNLREAATKEIAEWQREIASQASATALVRNGSSAYEEIVSAAEESNVDLIIVGNHGRNGVARMFIGSTAERVVRHAPCPVLVIRQREHDFLVQSGETKSANETKTTERL